MRGTVKTAGGIVPVAGSVAHPPIRGAHVLLIGAPGSIQILQIARWGHWGWGFNITIAPFFHVNISGILDPHTATSDYLSSERRVQ